MAKKLILKTLLWLNVLSVIAYLLACLSTVIDPVTFWWIHLLGLLYPVLLIINLSWFAFWLILMHKYMLLSLLTVVSTFFIVQRVLPFNFTQKKPPENAIKLLTYNVRNFDLYNWSQNLESRAMMMDIIKAEQPDILCLQEFYTEDSGQWDNLSYISQKLGYPYYYLERTSTHRQSNHWGIATFSKMPIEDKGKIVFPNSKNNIAIYTDIKLNGEPVRFFNLHLQSNHLADRDYRYLDTLFHQGDTKLTGLGAIIQKLKAGGEKRQVQADMLREAIDASPHSVVVCGDFNDTPVSYAYQQIKGDLQDAFIETGRGIGNTINGPVPYLRIDYILTSEDISVYKYEVIEEKYSDHYPVRCYISLN